MRKLATNKYVKQTTVLLLRYRRPEILKKYSWRVIQHMMSQDRTDLSDCDKTDCHYIHKHSDHVKAIRMQT